jgi:hypothetical protein
MLNREFVATDLEECLSIRTDRIGQESIGHKRALSAWKKLVKSASFKSVVIEAEQPIAGNRIVAFGSSVFVSRQFAEDEIANPRPGLNERIIASLDSGYPVILTDDELREQNSYGGLNMVVLFTSWRREGLTLDQIAAIKLDLAVAGVERFSGYRLERMMLEAMDETDVEYIESTGVYEMIGNFESSSASNSVNGWAPRRGLFVIDKVSAKSTVGSVAAIVFHFTPPIFRFRRGEQQLLVAALGGLTDPELAEELEVKIEALKKRWASIYARVAEIMPNLLPQSDNDPDQKRGPQKRHHLLAYLRHHPEELRPFVR